jgi:hypothetical protein
MGLPPVSTLVPTVISFKGQSGITGGTLSLTVTVNVVEEVFDAASDAVIVTVVVPTGNGSPDFGLELIV